MTEEKGTVLLIGKRRSGRTTFANMLVSGELKDGPLAPSDTNNNICETYAGRGWTVVDTMGFGEPLGGIVPEEYARKMVIDFLNEVKGPYSHIIFVVDISDILTLEEGCQSSISIMWNTFLSIFEGGEENFVVLVTKVKSRMWPAPATIEEMFPECKRFLYFNNFAFPEISAIERNGGVAEWRQKELKRIEEEMTAMFKTKPWVEPAIFKIGDEEMKEMATKIAHRLTSSLVQTQFDTETVYLEQPKLFKIGEKRQLISSVAFWRADDALISSLSSSLDDEPAMFMDCRIRKSSCVDFCSLNWIASRQTETVTIPVTPQVLRDKVSMVAKVQKKMENLGKKVKFYSHQCKHLLQRSLSASKEVHDLFDKIGMNWDRRDLEPLSTSLQRFVTCMKAGMDLLQHCGDNGGKEQLKVFLTMSSPESGRMFFSKFALVLRDLDWSLDLVRFLLHNPEAGPSAESARQSWLSKFWWCNGRLRLVYTGDSEIKLANGADLVESCVTADNERHALDQQDLISSYMVNHLSALGNKRSKSLLFSKKGKKNKLSESEIFSYMSILENRLQRNSPIQGSSTSMIPTSFWIPKKLDFMIIDFIGSGSFKSVHKCKWLGMEVAIATIHGENSRADLEAEAGILARVQHPNVVTFIGCTYDEKKQQGFLVTELMETSLRSLISRRLHGFMISVSIDMLLQIVEAMIHVHDCGVMHRDLKAENCLVSRVPEDDGYVVKLIDFGESKLRSLEMGSHFKTRNRGTRAWMAPEVIGKEGDESKLYTWSADVYSFGMTCYEIITGEIPFGTVMGRARALPEMICAGHRPVIPDYCPDDLREMMMKCWAHSPEDRPTFKEIRQTLWNLKLCHAIWKTK
ncbi:hypothetical protein M758_1G151800 [Ceratodon purpureus]|nr:hypothetical protein M758_1G151800 [Ceratodon purpureus]